VLLGAFLSFPVACLTGLIVLLLGMMGNFVTEATTLHAFGQPGAMDYVSHYLRRGAFFLLPNLPITSSPAAQLRSGTLIAWRAVGAEALTGTLIRAVVALALGSLIFRRRELARVQV